MSQTSLVKPSFAELASYVEALESGWSPDNIRKLEATKEQLEQIAADPAGFLASLDDPEAKGSPIRMLDGTIKPRLPSIRRWIWDGDFCGSIGLRWQNGTSELPDHVAGHIGYAVVPRKRGQGHATRALALILLEARCRGLDYVELTTDPENRVSQKVILACGGRLIEQFRKSYEEADSLRFRIDLA